MSYPNQQYPQQPGYPPAPPQYPQQQPQYPQQPYQPYPQYQQPAPGYQQPPRPPDGPLRDYSLDEFMGQAAQRGRYVNSFFRNPGQQLTMQVKQEVTKANVRPQTWQGQPKEPRWDGSQALKLDVPVLVAPSQDFPDGEGILELKPADWADLQDAMAQAGVPRGTWPQEGAWITAWFAGYGQARQGRQARKITGFSYQVPGTPRPGTTPYQQPQPAPPQQPYAQQPPAPQQQQPWQPAPQPAVPQNWQPPQPPAYPIGQPPPADPGQPPQGAPPQSAPPWAGDPGTAQFTPEGQAQQGPAPAAPPAMPSQMASLPPDQLAQMAALTGMDVSQLQGQPPQQ
jgi:hypothetical protein